MSYREQARLIRWTIRAVLLTSAAVIIGVLVGQALAPASTLGSFTVSPADTRDLGRPAGLDETGQVRDGVTVFDDETPAVARLDPDLLDALREAADAAADDDVVFHVNSGWRSADYQEQLLEAAIDEYGSAEEAARWVATPETSPHVSGEAVDLGPMDATSWLSQHGAAFGLCQIYGNESWHYELRPDAVDSGCPAMYADPTQDPRMR